jgi:hypothetical protein
MILRHPPASERAPIDWFETVHALAERHHARRLTDDRGRWPAPLDPSCVAPSIDGSRLLYCRRCRQSIDAMKPA